MLTFEAAGAGLGVGIYQGLKYGEQGSFKIRLNAILNASGKRTVTMANSAGVISNF
jgi:non-canonical (house-cleaning) NTP pyrophosphatase